MLETLACLKSKIDGNGFGENECQLRPSVQLSHFAESVGAAEKRNKKLSKYFQFRFCVLKGSRALPKRKNFRKCPKDKYKDKGKDTRNSKNNSLAPLAVLLE